VGVLLGLLAGYAPPGAILTAAAADRTIEFANAEKKGDGTAIDADDLHLEFNQPTIITSNPFNGNDRAESKNATVHNLYGVTVPGAGVGKVTVGLSAGVLDLKINRWWWTSGGNAFKDGTIISPEKQDNGGTKLSFLDGTATGDGSVNVQVNGASHLFATTAGFTPLQSAAAFDQFLEGLELSGFSLVEGILLDPFTVEALGNLQGDPATELNISILSQDSSQTLQLKPLAVVPEPSSILLLATGCAGAVWTVYCVRRRRAPA